MKVQLSGLIIIFLNVIGDVGCSEKILEEHTPIPISAIDCVVVVSVRLCCA